MRSKTELIKIASNAKEFSTKIKTAMDEGTLTPKLVEELADDILEVVPIIAEVAEEIKEGVPKEESNDALGNLENKPRQMEVANEETEEEKIKRLQKEAAEEDEEKKELKEKVAKLERKGALQELAPKYASLFPKEMHEAKLNEILNSKQPLNIVEAKIQEASDIITNKTMVKVASMADSPFGFANDTDSEEVNIANKI